MSRVHPTAIIAAGAKLAPSVEVGPYSVIDPEVTLGEQTVIGAHAMVAAGSIVLQDVPPYVTAAGYPAKPHGTNNEGLRRRGFSADDIAAIRRAYKTLYRKDL